jgi:acyl-CoA thioesterase I
VAPDHPALIFLGDSLTAGYGLAASESVPALIQAEVDRAGLAFRVVNAGRSGDTTAGGVARIDYYLRPEVRPRALVIWLGANDSMRGIPPTEIEANLRTIVQRAHAFDVSMPVLLVEMKAFPNLGADYAKAFEAIYPRIAESENAALLPFPLEGVAGHPDLNQADGVHPTAEGTRRVAATLWLSLRRHLGVH